MVRPNADEASVDDSERLARTSDEATDGWTRTLEDLEAMAADREAAGYETLTLPAADTTPKSPDTGETDEWGLAYVVGDEMADDLEAFDDGFAVDETGVYQASSTGYAFIVTECIDHTAEKVLFVAGTYRLQFAAPLVRTATDRGEMRTHVKRFGGPTVRTIEHDDVEAFFPDPERIISYEGVDH